MEIITPNPSARPNRITIRAFQNRFPKSEDGVSTKYDLVSLFLNDPEYATSLVANGPTRMALKKLIKTGVNRLEASPYVDLDVADAGNFTGLLMQPSMPTDFRLSAPERTAILSTAIAETERPA